MDAFWDPAIRCTGRTWPNGPIGAHFGSTGRPFPHWFTVVNPFELTNAEPLDYVYPMRWTTNQMSGTTAINSQWHWDRNLGTSGNWSLNLFCEFAAGPSIQMRLQANIFGGPFQRSATWTISLGFGVAPRSLEIEYLLTLIINGGGWGAGGPPTEMRIKYGAYAAMPSGRCIA